MSDVPEICNELRSLHRRREYLIKSRIMANNRLQMHVAIDQFDYYRNLPKEERDRRLDAADALIADVAEAGDEDHPLWDVISSTANLTGVYDAQCAKLAKAREKLARRLPIAAWVDADDQRGFGFGNLANIIGEAGDLTHRGLLTDADGNPVLDDEDKPQRVGYGTVGRFWKRMGCAPITKGGQTWMPSTWRAGSQGKLTDREWSDFGYCPRRRSVVYNLVEALKKGNFYGPGRPGPYSRRYHEAKAKFVAAHPGRVTCKKCKGSGRLPETRRRTAEKACDGCKGTGTNMAHAINHALLLVGKLALKNLLVEWNRLAGVKMESVEYEAVAS